MAKWIVICCDSTWNAPDQEDRAQVRPDNVTKIELATLPRCTRSSECPRRTAQYQNRFYKLAGNYHRPIGVGWE
jgi:hypothetical protein